MHRRKTKQYKKKDEKEEKVRKKKQKRRLRRKGREVEREKRLGCVWKGTKIFDIEEWQRRWCGGGGEGRERRWLRLWKWKEK